MDIALLKKLIKVVEQSKITEFSVQEGDLKVKISKNTNSNSFQGFPQPHHFTVAAPSVVEAPAKETKESVPVSAANLHEVRSPIVGTFYRAPAPDADAYAQVGDQITEGNVLCIVEAMKLMNEIESDASGKIVKILVENATPVEYNQPLFLIEKN
ncbi:MAG: acetyl-CoA carboxylase biotin carboxyl carrier protein [Bacteroidetes bacterium]|nr:acetyl-CoA carboxylase biotin carboxyl carrier protein [Bacteroidota bacterium]MBU1680961.1 acetyl-CoA carboxylase biotin carboxyl carrier protein [Bacteroidota bacterium]MBU2506121.1 acetyl-CoA carboxylase biotin carboxyl carrier protein [Bacteroidota bacterium]